MSTTKPISFSAYWTLSVSSSACPTLLLIEWYVVLCVCEQVAHVQTAYKSNLLISQTLT